MKHLKIFLILVIFGLRGGSYLDIRPGGHYNYRLKEPREKIGKVPIKDRPKWPFLIVGRVAAELWPGGLLNLDQRALEEYRSKDLYKIWARRPLNFWATKRAFF